MSFLRAAGPPERNLTGCAPRRKESVAGMTGSRRAETSVRARRGGGGGLAGARRRGAAGTARRALEHGAPLDRERGGLHLATEDGGLLELDRLLRLDVPVHLALDDERAGGDLGVHLRALAHHENPVGHDRALEDGLDPHRPGERELPFEPDAAANAEVIEAADRNGRRRRGSRTGWLAHRRLTYRRLARRRLARGRRRHLRSRLRRGLGQRVELRLLHLVPKGHGTSLEADAPSYARARRRIPAPLPCRRAPSGAPPLKVRPSRTCAASARSAGSLPGGASGRASRSSAKTDGHV